ncbi:MAG: hypothetical protein DMG09_10370 [Acidobacteria bacterium]|nr:MAG: hypothetical protein DMG09_10370 [Acidobacteriota bacterium]
MLVARALPAGLGASSKMYTLFPDGPLATHFTKYAGKTCHKFHELHEFLNSLAPREVWLQIKPMVRQKGGSFRLIRGIRGQASFGFLVGKRFVILRVFASSR